MSNRVVHFEIPCDDPQRTMDFFKQVFGWKFEPGPSGKGSARKIAPNRYASVKCGSRLVVRPPVTVPSTSPR